MIGNSPLTSIGWMAAATGTVESLALVMALLSFAFGRAFGRVHDALVGAAAILSAGLGMLFFSTQGQDLQLTELALALALVGAFLAGFGSVLATTEAASWFSAQLYVAAGYALLGGWLIIVNVLGSASHSLPNRVVNVGVFAGVVMALGVAAIPGILAGADAEETSPWISRTIGRAGNLGWLILYPLWCFWLGSALI